MQIIRVDPTPPIKSTLAPAPTSSTNVQQTNYYNESIVVSVLAMEKASLHGLETLEDAALLTLDPGQHQRDNINANTNANTNANVHWLTSVLANDSLFVRPCYRILFVLATTFLATTLEPYSIIVTGSYGVGKRSFLSYVYFRLRTLGAVHLGDRTTSFRSELAERSTFYLCDGMDQSPLCGSNVLAKTLAVLPAVRGTEDAFIQRECRRITFAMPLWSLHELSSCRAACYPSVSPEELTQRRGLWGGLVQWTLATPFALAQAQFAKSLAQLTLATAAALIESRGYVGTHHDTSDAAFLIHMDVEENDTFQLREASLCSPRVCAELVTRAPSMEHVLCFLQPHRSNYRLGHFVQQLEILVLRELIAL